ncbi:MAG TPA: hypothetical protein ENF67_00400 [Candidatus Pacearchaeota archaeon]|nr:hypothetical protein [Candidatus Pacearchaeota archaeon]
MFVTFNIGKKGLTNGFLDLLEKTFKKNELVRISILKVQQEIVKKLRP